MDVGAGDGQTTVRSADWFAAEGRQGFLHRSWIRNQGFTDELFDGRPVIGIANSWSELTPCNAHLRTVAEAVKRGVFMAGGFPLEFPTMSLGETIMRPTTMLYRNLMAMEVEESLRANPLDGVVLLSGCDKTTPAQLMGAASVDLPVDHGHRRAHAKREVPRARHRIGYRCVAADRGVPGRPDRGRRSDRSGDLYVAQCRSLHDHGHGVDHGLSGRGLGHAAARVGGHSRRRLAAAGGGPESQGRGSSRWCAAVCDRRPS